jgi:diguanylate cyclase (GGDEF)-like protein/PAS domain S-box-containing protein
LVNRRKDGTLFDCHVSITASYDNAGGLQHFIGDIADISERKRAEHEIHELNRDFVAFLENTTDFVYFKDEHSRFRFCSQTLARITGHAHWRDMRGKHDLEVFPQETAQIYVEEELPIFHDGVPLINKIDPYRDADGSLGWVATSKWPVLDGAGLVIGLFGISRDITAAKKSEEQLTLAASVFANSREAIMITSTDSTIVDVNDAFTRITGYARGEVLGQTPHILASGRHDSDFYATLWRSLSEKGHWYGEVWNRRKNGEVYAEMQTISTVRDAQGVAQHFVSLFSDITTLKEHQLQLEHIAHFDALTNLPNRVLLADRMRQSMASTLRRGNLMAVAYLDLDGFKLINDQHGHEAGDKLLIALASHMREVLRDGDTLARIGGDEFVVVLVDLEDMQVCAPLLNRLLLAAAQTVTMDATDLQVSASVGVTFFQHGDEVDAEQLLRQADQAMYHAKLAGKNRYHVFNAEHDRSVRGHHENLENIRQAFRDSEFVLHYQPKVNMRTGQVIGAEALIRWQHPQHGLLYPAVFLPVFDEDPLAVEVGDWVIETALHQMEQWQAQGLAMAVSVNVGARQMQQPDFVERLRAALARHPSVQPQHFQIEILETSALEDVDQASAVIAQCGTLGVAFAMDDFGTGYSSLTYLKRLRVKVLKMDQSFVRDVRTNPDDTAILKSIVGLASAFQCSVIAEGVETTAHGRALLALGCDLAQGYGIARPMPADQLPAWASGWRPEPEWLVSP